MFWLKQQKIVLVKAIDGSGYVDLFFQLAIIVEMKYHQQPNFKMHMHWTFTVLRLYAGETCSTQNNTQTVDQNYLTCRSQRPLFVLVACIGLTV